MTSIGLGSISVDADALGPATLTANGYNVVTWDARGWYQSGGQVNLDDPHVEGRDVTAIINWLATQPAAELKAPGDPVVGMTGFSYGGGIQLSTAVLDHRLAAIEPNMSWNSALDSLYPNQVIKQGWGNILCGLGDALGARYSPIVGDLCTTVINGQVTPAELSFGSHVSVGSLVSNITAPTLLLGGTVRAVPVQRGRSNLRLPEGGRRVRQDDVVLRRPRHLRSCCRPSTHVTDIELEWFDKYLKGENVDTGPGFEYLDQTGTWRSAPAYPVAATGSVTGSGGGWLGISSLDTFGLLGVEAGPRPTP